MRTWFKLPFSIIILSGFFALAGCDLFPKGPGVPDAGEDPGGSTIKLFSDDFSAESVGGRPSEEWVVTGTIDYLQIVEDAAAVGGKAVRIRGNSNEKKATQMHVTRHSGHPIVVAEHSVRWEGGTGLYYWLDFSDGSFGSDHNIAWYPAANGNLTYIYKDGDGNTKYPVIGKLVNGWNRVRVVADLENEKAYIYLNDVLGVEGLPFRNPVNSWNLVRLTFYDGGQDSTESYYDDVIIWAISSEGADEFRTTLAN